MVAKIMVQAVEIVFADGTHRWAVIEALPKTATSVVTVKVWHARELRGAERARVRDAFGEWPGEEGDG